MNEWQMNPRMNERTERPEAGIRESGDENANPGGSSGADGGISEASGSPIPAGGSGSEPRLLARLAAYCASDALPMHMPGHKRNRQALQLPEPVDIDITEIDGFDNLHGAEDLLLACQRRAARVFGAEETHFLVNGSSGGILSAIAACVPRGGALLMGRNAHRAALNAVTIGGIRPEYLYPAFLPESGISGAIAPEQVDAALGRRPDIRCVFITSPTYEGVISDVAAIADACHRHGAVLIVDEAHGAHLGFGGFPESAVRLGADVSVQSVHKTLGSLTQTALLHVSGPRVDRERLRRMLSVYQTSSPSYVLMASIDECVLRMEAQGDALADRWLANVAAFRRAVGGLRHLKLLPVEAASCGGAAVGADSVDGATARGGAAVGADSSGNAAARGGAAVGADSSGNAAARGGAAVGADSVDGAAARSGAAIGADSVDGAAASCGAAVGADSVDGAAARGGAAVGADFVDGAAARGGAAVSAGFVDGAAASCGAAVGAGFVDGAASCGGAVAGAGFSGNVAARGSAAVGAGFVDGATARGGTAVGAGFVDGATARGGAAVGTGFVDGAAARGGAAVGADSVDGAMASCGAAVGADSVDGATASCGAAVGAGSVDGVAACGGAAVGARFVDGATFRFDSSKIVISTRGTNIGGPELQRMLRERFHIELEMAAGHYAIAMTGIGDTEASLIRLADALLTIDAELTDVDAPAPVDPLSPRPQMVLTPAEADLVPAEDVPVDAAAGRTCAETVFAYPPGIPLMVPGERVDGGLLARLLAERARGVALHSQTGGLPEVLRCIRE